MNHPFPKLPYPVIDAHVHPFVESSQSISRYGLTATTEEFFDELKKCGFQKVCGSVLGKDITGFEDIRRLNRQMMALKRQYPDFYEPGIHVYGKDAKASCEEVENLHREEDVRWIGELVNYSMDIGEYNSPGMLEIFSLAADLEMVVNIHCGDLAVMEDVCRNVPRLKVVLAHPGDVGSALERLDFIRRYENAYIDISGTGLFRWGLLTYAIKTIGASKILFGSDFPVCSAGMNLGGVLAEPLSDEELMLILGGNFLRLIGR